MSLLYMYTIMLFLLVSEVVSEDMPVHTPILKNRDEFLGHYINNASKSPIPSINKNNFKTKLILADIFFSRVFGK